MQMLLVDLMESKNYQTCVADMLYGTGSLEVLACRPTAIQAGSDATPGNKYFEWVHKPSLYGHVGLQSIEVLANVWWSCSQPLG